MQPAINKELLRQLASARKNDRFESHNGNIWRVTGHSRSYIVAELEKGWLPDDSPPPMLFDALGHASPFGACPLDIARLVARGTGQ